MGFLNFLGGGGGDLITGLTGTIAGAISSAKDRGLQKELQQQHMEYITVSTGTSLFKGFITQPKWSLNQLSP